MRPVAYILCAMMAASAAAQPADVNRILRVFDFEERRLGNAEELPMHWSKVEGPNLPHYVNGRLTTDRARGGRYSFRFDLNGGGLIYRYDTDQIRVRPGAHYRVEGYVQTTPLPNARARISAYFADQDGNAIPSTVRHSELFASRPGDSSWHRLTVELSADADTASSNRWQPLPTTLVIELSLLQPMHYAANSLGQRTLYTQDIRGTAWFDDVAVSQVPKVTMSTDRPGNIFGRSDAMVLKVLVNDRFTDDLAAQLVITDATGKAVYQRSGALDMSSAQTLGPGRKRMALSLPELLPGWYEAALVMTSQGQFVGRQKLDMVLLADDAPPSAPDPRFGVIATDLPFDGWDDLPEILSILSAGRVKLAVWSDAGDVQQLDSAGFDRLLSRLADLRIEPTACLVSLPPEIARHIEGRTAGGQAGAWALADSPAQSPWVQLLKVDTALWQPQLAFMLSRHANHLQRWQLGADGSDEFVTNPQMRQVYARIYREFANLVEKPDLAMPWPAWYELEGQLPATVALHVKPEVLPSQIPLYVKDLSIHDGHHLSIYLQPLDPAQYGREVQIRDLAQRIVYALSSDARGIDVQLPFTVLHEQQGAGEGGEDQIIKQPQELLLIIRTLMATLGGTSFRGKVPAADGVEAFLFDRDGQGILVLWDRGVTGGTKQLAVNLGPNSFRIDLWGNVTPLLASAAGHGDNVRLEVGPMPILLIGVDAQLAQLRASVAIDNPLLESSFKPHSRRIRFVNPFRQAIAGSVRLTSPDGWLISPPSLSFSLNPGETFDREITLEFPYNSFAGPKTINAAFQMQDERNSAFVVPIALKLGLSDVGLQTLALRDGNDVIVQQMITNYGDKPIDYTAFAIYPGQARQERLVTNLAAGRTTIRKFRFVNVKIAPGAKVRSGVRELDGTRMLNDEVPIQ